MRIGRAAWGVSDAKWNDWRWQQQNRLCSAAALAPFLRLSADERRACELVTSTFPMAVTPYYLSLMDDGDPDDPLRLQAIPRLAELEVLPTECPDPLAEGAHTPAVAPVVVHRYEDRALLYVTHNCPVYCRHCFRRRKVGDPRSAPSRDGLAAGLRYIASQPQIRDVLVSGGDPLTFSDTSLGELLGELRQIAHVEIIRIATRNPATLPQRITDALAATLARFHPIYVNTQFNHPRECTEAAAVALERLVDAGCVAGNQTVLLRGINDEALTIADLNRWLLRHRCRPYYLLQCDMAAGISHFRTPLRSGVEIICALRGHISGLGIPHFVVDLPGGGGKVPLARESLVRREDGSAVLGNHRGEVFVYPDPE